MAKDLVTTTGKTYQDAQIRKFDAAGVTIVHDEGVTTLPYSVLPNELKDKLRPRLDPSRDSIISFGNSSVIMQATILKALKQQIYVAPDDRLISVYDTDGSFNGELADEGFLQLTDDYVIELLADGYCLTASNRVVKPFEGEPLERGDIIKGMAQWTGYYFFTPPTNNTPAEPDGLMASLGRMFKGDGASNSEEPPKEIRLKKYEMLQLQPISRSELIKALDEDYSFNVVVPIDVTCPECRGMGTIEDCKAPEVFDHYEVCPRCRGTGRYVKRRTKRRTSPRGGQITDPNSRASRLELDASFETEELCPSCEGSGRIKIMRHQRKTCPTCRGRRVISEERLVTVVK
jgi:hypothetical protein